MKEYVIFMLRQRMSMYVCLFVRDTFSQFSCDCIIMKLSRVIASEKSDVHTTG